MDASRAKSVVEGTRFARLDWVEATGSTNADLVAVARSGGPQQVRFADHQDAGRGRLGRVWQAPPASSLLCSMLVRPRCAPGELHLVTTAVGLAAAEACESVTGVRLGLKWPNDLVAPGAAADGSDLKVSGILAETTSVDGHIDAVVVGIGLNVNWPDAIPDDLATIATSLRHLTGAEVDRDDLAAALVTRADHWLGELDDCRLDEMRNAYHSWSATVGRDVRVELASEVIVGRATDIDRLGALVVIDDRGAEHRISVGDVVHLRPATNPPTAAN